MENTRINIEEYPEYLGDIYYSLLTIVENYVNQNFDSMKSLTSEHSDYAEAKKIGKVDIYRKAKLFIFLLNIKPPFPKNSIPIA